MRRLCVELRWSFWDLWDLLVTEWARVRLPAQRIVPPDWPSKVLVTVRGIQNDGGEGDDVLPLKPLQSPGLSSSPDCPSSERCNPAACGWLVETQKPPFTQELAAQAVREQEVDSLQVRCLQAAVKLSGQGPGT